MAQLTKEELIEKLGYLNEDKLEKLLSYAENIMIPDENILMDVTMVQLVEKGFSLADTYFPQWTDRGIADFGRFLLELFAIFSEKDFYYINAYANENLLSKMNIYSDAFMRVVEMGYYPSVSSSSRASFSFTFESSENSHLIPRGGLIAQVKDTDYSYTNLFPLEVPSSIGTSSVAVELNEGKIIKESFQFNGFSIYLSKNNIDTETLIVTIDELEWSRVRTFGRSIANSNHYIAIPEDDGSIRIYFGNNEYGKRPDLNQNISVNYLQCNTDKSNGIQGDCTVSKFPSERRAINVTILGATSGGSNPDTLGDLKNKGRNFFTTQFTLNNAFAVNDWLNSQYDVKKAYVKIINNNVKFKVVSALTDGTTEQTVLSNLAERMSPIINGGYYPQPELTTYVNISSFNAQIYMLKGYDLNLAEQRVASIVSDYTNPYILADYGVSFIKQDLTILLKSRVPGLQNIIYTDINGAIDDIILSNDQVMGKIPFDNLIIDTFEV